MRDHYIARGANGTEATEQFTVCTRLNHFGDVDSQLFSYGVARVYGEQCSYVLIDAQNAQNNMRALFRTVKQVELEGKHTARYDKVTIDQYKMPGLLTRSRPDQLNLKDDTRFLLEDLVMLDFDQRDIDLTSSDSSLPDSLLSPHRSISTGLGSEHGDPTIGEVVIPPSASSSIGGRDAFSLGGSGHAGSGRGSRFGSSMFRREEDDRLFDPGFAFDDMGNMVDSAPDGAEEAAVLPEHPALRDPAILSDDHRTDHDMRDADEDIVSTKEIMIDHSADPLKVYQHDDDAMLPGQDDLDSYANAEAFTTRPQQSAQPANSSPRQSSASVQPNEPDEPGSDHADEESATAPAVRRRKRKGIAPDVQQELGNRDISGWSNNYLNQMQEVLRGKTQARSTALAKKNADFWVLQNGVGGLGVTYGQEDIPEPLRMFTGHALLEALTGLRLAVAGEKHAREEGDGEVEDEADENQRRVRARSDEDDAIGRADGDVVMEDTMYLGDDAGNMVDDSAELPRDEVSV